ncbi:ATP synthase F1 subunit epsilon [Candidatus Parcubacteria bacterium]|nr:MAG: ATP synthase F1 subunit epsilon [Candidatus Parcubacteria bacterium]
MSLLKLKIISLSKIVFEGEVLQVSAPTETGEIGVLADHVPLVSVLKEGITTVKDRNGSKRVFKTAKGLIEVRPKSEVVVLTDAARELEN